MMIFYNGSTGSLGFHFAGALTRSALAGAAIHARLGDGDGTRSELEAAFAGSGPVALVQMAAKVSVPECERDAAAAQRTNVEETTATVRAFLDWAASRQLEARVVYVSTGHVYAEMPAGRRAKESDATAPRSVYARTKLQAEARLTGLCEERGTPFFIARVFGLLAPRQPPHYVLPALIRRVQERSVRGIPGLDYARDYLDARDVCDCLVRLAVAAPSAPVINVCSGHAVTIRELLADARAGKVRGREQSVRSHTRAAHRRTSADR